MAAPSTTPPRVVQPASSNSGRLPQHQQQAGTSDRLLAPRPSIDLNLMRAASSPQAETSDKRLTDGRLSASLPPTQELRSSLTYDNLPPEATTPSTPIRPITARSRTTPSSERPTTVLDSSRTLERVITPSPPRDRYSMFINGGSGRVSVRSPRATVSDSHHPGLTDLPSRTSNFLGPLEQAFHRIVGLPVSSSPGRPLVQATAHGPPHASGSPNTPNRLKTVTRDALPTLEHSPESVAIAPSDSSLQGGFGPMHSPFMTRLKSVRRTPFGGHPGASSGNQTSTAGPSTDTSPPAAQSPVRLRTGLSLLDFGLRGSSGAGSPSTRRPPLPPSTLQPYVTQDHPAGPETWGRPSGPRGLAGAGGPSGRHSWMNGLRGGGGSSAIPSGAASPDVPHSGACGSNSPGVGGPGSGGVSSSVPAIQLLPAVFGASGTDISPGSAIVSPTQAPVLPPGARGVPGHELGRPGHGGSSGLKKNSLNFLVSGETEVGQSMSRMACRDGLYCCTC